MADDFSEIPQLVADLSGVPEAANRNIRKALEVTGRNVRDDWREGAEMSGNEGFSGKYASSIFYDVQFPGGAIEVEIGPELGRPGGSAGFLEEATGDVNAPPLHAGRDTLESNEADFLHGIELAIFDALYEAIEE